MEFDVFEKLSELETRIFFLEKELEDKDAIIQALTVRNTQLEQEQTDRSKETAVIDLEKDCDLAAVESGKSIAEVLKEASETAFHNTGYIFDDRIGLYFDRNSGYYYDPENHLFFEPKSGMCYRYNSVTGAYTRQSSVDYHHWEKQYRRLLIRLSVHDPQDAAPLILSPGRYNHSGRSNNHRSHRHNRRYRSLSRSPSHGHSRQQSWSSDSSNSTDHRSFSRRHRLRRRGSGASNESSSKRRRKRYSGDRTCVEKPSDDTEMPNGSPPASDQPTTVIAKPVVYPPGVRLVVLTSEYTSPGTVFILTSDESSKGWGCIGRNPTFCPSVNFPDDPAVGTIHCEVIYKSTEEQYVLLDRESSSGTYVNGEALQKQTPFLLSHGDVVRIGSSRLLVHIHRGLEVCAQCDPEVIKLTTDLANAEHSAVLDASCPRSTQTLEEENAYKLSTGLSSREAERRATLDMLKEKYGVKHCALKFLSSDPKTYNDRAAQRRAIQANLKATGYVDAAPPPFVERPVKNTERLLQASTVSVSLGMENRGAQLMSKMGWSLGQGLGRNASGMVEPVSVSTPLNSRAGFGSVEQRSRSEVSVPTNATPQDMRRARIHAITSKRFEKLE
ncbi:G patch and FHA domains-containing Angiogenic factor [Paragonimus heterotremus]|uniref:G patch and FHA domains-containing Angiogenic factor n=1 Tax=Paragonimus heterotremus TaxID=100268 RepID=A0A8J4TEC2_9TREM|nr:G patch and FHA domains-containing Angiogenic factor [Paragonimus heterotremus]